MRDYLAARRTRRLPLREVTAKALSPSAPDLAVRVRTARQRAAPVVFDLGSKNGALLRQSPQPGQAVRHADGQREKIQGQIEDRRSKQRVRGNLDSQLTCHPP